jgi:Tfp pilus assembly protein PilO
LALKAKVSTIKQMEQHLEDLKGENHRQDQRIHELEALLAETIEVRRIVDAE